MGPLIYLLPERTRMSNWSPPTPSRVGAAVEAVADAAQRIADEYERR